MFIYLQIFENNCIEFIYINYITVIPGYFVGQVVEIN